MLKFKNLWLREKLIISFSAVFMVVITIQFLFFYLSISKEMEKKASNYSLKVIEKIGYILDSYFNEMQNILVFMANDNNIYEMLSKKIFDEFDLYENNRNIRKLFFNLIYNRAHIYNLTVVGFNDMNYSSHSAVRSGSNVREYPWFRQAVAKNGQVQFSNVHKQDYLIGRDGNEVISAAILIKTESGNTGIGVAICDLNVSKLSETIGNLNFEYKDSIFLLNPEGQIVFSSRKDLGDFIFHNEIHSKMKNEDNGSFLSYINGVGGLIVFHTLKSNNWRIMAFIPIKELNKLSGSLIKTTIMIAAVGMALIVLLSVAISFGFTKPIRKLIDRIALVEEGKFEESKTIDTFDEIGLLSRRFDRMVKKINQLINENYHSLLKQKEAEVSSLMAQINPHFLYNTLQSIKSLAILGKTEELSKAVTALANLFKNNINISVIFITIKKEIEYAASYMEIQKIRHGSRFSYEINLNENIEEYYTMRLILQPIVENSIIHGLKGIRRHMKIFISVEQKDNCIIYTIKDTGSGIDEEKLLVIREQLRHNYDTEKKGSIGIYNVNARLKTKFGENYGLSISSKIGEGTEVNLTVPIIKKLKGDENV